MHHISDNETDSTSDDNNDLNSIDTSDMDSDANPANMNDMMLVLIGSPGSGKSATGNTILKENRFKTAMQAEIVTDCVDLQSFTYEGMQLTIVDTPGIYKEADLRKTLDAVTNKTKIGNAVFGVTIRVGRLSNKETTFIHDLLMNHIELRFCLIFTNIWELAEFGKQFITEMFKQFLKETPEIKKLIETHGFKYCLIENNKTKIDEHHADELLKKLIEVIGSIPKPVKRVDVMQKRLDQRVSLTMEDVIDIIKIVNPNENLPVETIQEMICDIGSKLSIEDFKRELGPVISGK